MSQRTREQTIYEREHGPDALRRQIDEALNRFACCGEKRKNGHHQACHHYVPPKVEQKETLFG